ncbi:hypothetical protein [Nonomuraea indica]|uniref:hypothetical protein n=1 Tax=Nonomuraea indica TaxID=1581193 RepID=UPI000C7BDEEF|nr:hypothetical protein [Nonomuraea indica]
MIVKTTARLAVSAAVAVGTLTFTVGAAAAATSPVTALGSWYVAATYPNTAQGWRDCGNATVNVYKGHCKLDSETGLYVNLWGYRA